MSAAVTHMPHHFLSDVSGKRILVFILIILLSVGEYVSVLPFHGSGVVAVKSRKGPPELPIVTCAHGYSTTLVVASVHPVKAPPEEAFIGATSVQ